MAAVFQFKFWPWDECIGTVEIKQEEEKEKGEGKKKKKKKTTKTKPKKPMEPLEEITHACETLFRKIDEHPLKKCPIGKTNFSDLRSFIEDSKIPSLSYERYISHLKPKNGVVIYTNWKDSIVKNLKLANLEAIHVGPIVKALKHAYSKIDAELKKTKEEKEKVRKARHIHGMDPGQYMETAQLGDKQAQYYLANCYHFGRGCNVDHQEAVKWYKRAAMSDHADSCTVMGLLCESGKGVQENLEEAFQWYTKAAELGNSRAQRNLAICYEYGRGTDKDVKNAKKWYERAASNKEVPSFWAEHTLKFFDERHVVYLEEKKKKEEDEAPIDPALADTAARVKESLAKADSATKR